jgi:hypothetical protein
MQWRGEFDESSQTQNFLINNDMFPSFLSRVQSALTTRKVTNSMAGVVKALV